MKLHSNHNHIYIDKNFITNKIHQYNFHNSSSLNNFHMVLYIIYMRLHNNIYKQQQNYIIDISLSISVQILQYRFSIYINFNHSLFYCYYIINIHYFQILNKIDMNDDINIFLIKQYLGFNFNVYLFLLKMLICHHYLY